VSRVRATSPRTAERTCALPCGQSVLLDAGTLVAILNRNDRHHADLTELLECFERQLFTTWCDFADASLLYAAWNTKVRDVWTIDSDFSVYRLPDRSRFKINPSR
jgi:predicted nucleic acid-binding protein